MSGLAPEPSGNTDRQTGKAADELVRIALDLYRLGRDEAHGAFAVERAGPNVALMLDDPRGLRARLAREYWRAFGRTAGTAALTDALAALEGEALDTLAEPVALRVGLEAGGIVLDLGDPSGAAVVIRPGEWVLVERSPILFRRTALTAALPAPTGGSVEALRGLLNVAPDSWPLVRAWLVASLFPQVPHPILLLGGLQGTGKSTACRLLVELVDPSPAPLRSQPRDAESWAIAASGSWIVGVDNVSKVPPWWSDALCRTVTGDGWLKRRLYTNAGLSVLSFRRVVALTSIDAGALRGDLAERLLLVDLEPIPKSARRSEAELLCRFEDERPAILGGLLDLVSATLAELPYVDLDELPRLADFARITAALDASDASDGRALALYLRQGDRIAADVLEGDVVASALVTFVDTAGPWEGTATELLERITPEAPSRDWPHSGQSLAGCLRRLTPALGAVGIDVVFHRESTHERRRLWSIARVGA